MRFSEKFAECFMIFAALGGKICLIVLILIIGLIKSCVEKVIDPIDRSINKSQEIVCLLKVVDSIGNGFRVHYITANPVTTERYKEIISRTRLQKAFELLQQNAPCYFGGSLLNTDIYDFAVYAKKFDICSDVHIDCIFVTGPQKSAFYAQPNPNLPNGVTWIDPRTEQGLQWVKHSDIYSYKGRGKRIYRYWKCPGMREISLSDERFTHYTLEEKIY